MGSAGQRALKEGGVALFRAQEMISMQMRCKLLNEFAIRRGGCQARAVPAGFMNGPAWGGGGGAPARPHISLLKRPRHAAPHVAASRPRRDLARHQRVSCFRRGAGGCGPESPPRRPPAGDASGPTTRPLGPEAPGGGDSQWRPFSLLLEWFPEGGDSEISLQALFPSGWAALGRHWPQEGGVPLTWKGKDLGRDNSI